MEVTFGPPILFPGIDYLPCLQELRSVKDKPFYCQSFEPYGNGDDDDGDETIKNSNKMA